MSRPFAKSITRAALFVGFFGGGFLSLGCSATTLRATDPAESPETTIQTPDLDSHTRPREGSGQPSDTKASQPKASQPKASQPKASQPKASQPQGENRAACPLDEHDGEKAAEVAGVENAPRNQETMQKIISAHRGCIRRCYEAARQSDANLQGDFTVALKIDPEGEVTDVTLNQERSQIRSTSMLECASAALKKLKFPEHEKGFESTMNYPFNFKP